jgi:type II secretory pathway component GspD/PulD (secretin)
MNEKQVNVKIMSNLTDIELEELLNALRSIDGFNFFVDSQFTITNRVKEEKS